MSLTTKLTNTVFVTPLLSVTTADEAHPAHKYSEEIMAVHVPTDRGALLLR